MYVPKSLMSCEQLRTRKSCRINCQFVPQQRSIFLLVQKIQNIKPIQNNNRKDKSVLDILIKRILGKAFKDSKRENFEWYSREISKR